MHVDLIHWVRQAFKVPSNNIPVWDGWRGMAIAWVLLGHFFATGYIEDDRLGVDAFFVLSGMLMARLLFEQRVDLRTFYVRRFSRIYPALLAFVFYVFSVSALAGWSFSWLEVFTNLTFLRTYVPAAPHIWAGDVPVKNLWSLSVEEHAYLLMSLIALFVVQRHIVILLLLATALTAVGFSTYYYQTQNYHETYFLIRTECAIVFVALSAAYRLLQQQQKLSAPGWLAPATLLMATVCYLEVMPFWLQFTVAPVLLSLSVNHLQDSAEFAKRLFAIPALRLLGLWSYSIYLWQQPFYEYQWALPGPGFLIPLALSLLAGFLSYAFLERPARHAINHWWSGR